MKKKFKKTLRSNTHPIKPKMVITSKKDKLNILIIDKNHTTDDSIATTIRIIENAMK